MRMMKAIGKYQAILFDLDDTLISLRGCEAEALQRSLAEAGLLSALPSSLARVTHTFAAISGKYWAARTQDGDTSIAREQVVENSLRDFLAHFNLNTAPAGDLALSYWREFCRSSALNPGAMDTVQTLSGRFQLGVITNGYIDSQRGRLDAAGLTRFFDPVLISEAVCVAKPDARIFQMALAALDLRPEDVIYVGDSISHDYQGCQNAGIDFCHYFPQDNVGTALPQVKLRISRLIDLLDIFAPPN